MYLVRCNVQLFVIPIHKNSSLFINVQFRVCSLLIVFYVS